jgi:hypothetical protein
VGADCDLYGRPSRGKSILVLAVLPALIALMGAFYVGLTTAKDPFASAESRCPGAADGVDSSERQECLAAETTRSSLSVASPWIRAATVIFTAGSGLALWISRTHAQERGTKKLGA